MSNKPVKVSVTVVTYNQINYIGECLESIVTQETNFPFEVIVGDDCSTDGAIEVIKQYVAKYPKLIKPIFHEKNTFTIDKSNFRDVIEAARGEYIAHIDGDDLMLPGKLQKQVEFLDNHPECCVCHHQIEFMLPEGRKSKIRTTTTNKYPHREKIIGLSEFLDTDGGRPHISRMYRMDSRPQSGFIYDINLFCSDYVWLIQLLIHSQKKAGYIDETLGIHRMGVGILSKPNSQHLCLAGILKAISLAEESGLVGIEQLNKAKSRAYEVFARKSLKDKDYANFVNGIVKSRSYFPSRKNFIFYGMRHFPRLASFFYRKYLLLRS